MLENQMRLIFPAAGVNATAAAWTAKRVCLLSLPTLAFAGASPGGSVVFHRPNYGLPCNGISELPLCKPLDAPSRHSAALDASLLVPPPVPAVATSEAAAVAVSPTVA